ncbi:BrnT family toxin [Acidobacteria bacterium AH-259-O06]|nr:BrnT family toxin [Acidobacteria bacterium AH-259-O06]
MQFEWDTKKAGGNFAKHKVSFAEASTVFGDPLALTIDYPDHSLDERRYITTGISAERHLIIVSHTYREGIIRIISARRATRNERNQYESKAQS